MPENSFKQFLSKKAYEISYAVFRVAAASKKRSFTEHLERQALSFLASAARADYVVSREASTAMEYLLRLGVDIGIVNRANLDSITSEIMAFDAAIAGSEKAANPEAIDLESIFSKLPVPVGQVFPTQGTITNAASSNPENQEHPRENVASNGSGNGHSVVKAAIRQSTILERIRQNGNCRLKEIQEVLPEASERTVRYDLQNLLEQGLIERIGNGGPAISYKAKE